jgi:very-short-patch-repair endonuclease
MTESETLLWERLRGNKLGVRFRRQAIVLGYIADFWCPTFRLVVELDGACHAERVAYDAERDRNLAKHGIHTLRIPSRQVFSDMAGVIRRIKQSFDQAD